MANTAPRMVDIHGYYTRYLGFRGSENGSVCGRLTVLWIQQRLTAGGNGFD